MYDIILGHDVPQFPRYLMEAMKAETWRETEAVNTQENRREEASKNASQLRDMKIRYDIILESNADLQQMVDNLQSKEDLLSSLMGEYFFLKVQFESHSSQDTEDEARTQELLEKKAQMEVEKQKCSDELDKVKSQLIHLRYKSLPASASTFSLP